MLVQTAHRVAAALAVFWGGLAVLAGNRYLQAHGGWDVESGNADLMVVMVLVVGCVLALSFAVLRLGARNANAARLTSFIWSVTLLAALFFTWHVIVVSQRWAPVNGTSITSQADFDAFVSAHPDSFAGYQYRVPTGVYLQSFEFLNANNVEMSGYVWQKYGPEIPQTVQRGIVFPEALEHAYDAHEAWRIEQNGGEEIGWYFYGIFRQNFDYRLYPFDRQGVWLRLWSPEPTAGVLLVPDFSAYRDLNPETLPGIDTQFVYSAWDPIGAEFSYDLVDYNTDFGIGYGASNPTDPEFFYNFAVERDFLGPILEHVVLEVAIAIILFLLLVLMDNESGNQERVGLTIFDLIVAAGGLLFAVILDHNAMRSSIESQTLTYLEWFPLVLAIFIVLVVLSAVLNVRRWRLPVLGYTGDLVPVPAYWPALIGTYLVITLLVFFY